MADNNSGGGGFVLGLFIGGVIGGMAGLLLAPKSGSQTRAELRELGDTWRTRADEMAADLRARGMPDLPDVTGRVGPAVDSLRERGSSTIEAVRDAGAGAVASAKEGVSAVRSRMGGGDGLQPVTESGEPDDAAADQRGSGTA
jgi:gas vesicle protein